MKTAFLLAFLVLTSPLFAQNLKQQLLSQGLEVSDKPLAQVDFELTDLSGAKVKLSALKGKVVVLNFWATWCNPCMSEMPSLQRLFAAYKDQGLTVLAVDLQEDKATVQAKAKELGLEFPILLDAAGSVGGTYNARAIPTTYLVDRKGMIFSRIIGAREWDTKEMMEIFRRILKDEPVF